MKRGIQLILQRLLGIRLYLYWLSRFQLFVQQYIVRDLEFLHFLSLIPETGVIGDIGANLGVTAVSIAQKRPMCRVVAFEPIPVNFTCCSELFSKFQIDRIHLYKLALSDGSGQLTMSIPKERGVFMHGLSKVVEEHENNTHMIKVQALSLDEIPEFNLPNRVVALKIDVENFEWNVLRGAVRVITDHRPIIFCEVWNTIRRNQTFDWMRNLGYGTWVFDGKKLIPFSNQQALNFFFLPNDSSFTST